MSWRYVFYGVFISTFNIPAQAADQGQNTASFKSPAHDRSLDRLVAAYPDFLIGHKHGRLLWSDGTKTIFDDGQKKNFDQRLNAPDPQDMFYAPYPKARTGVPPRHNSDPGRVRYEPLFKKMYGSSKAQVKANLTSIVWLPKKWGKKVKVTRVNGVAEQLQKISNDLDKLPDRFTKFLIPAKKSDWKYVPGIFNWRFIKGTKRLSVHSFGAALDLEYLQYWRTKTWKSKPHSHDASHKHDFRNTMPWEIVEIFERHGFIWGGKWYHYDTMHFEYRPELLAKN